MTVDELRDCFRQQEAAENKEAKAACKALVLATLAPKLFERAGYEWFDQSQREKEAGDATIFSCQKARCKAAIRGENIRRAVKLANEIAEAAFGGDTFNG